jgi:hypothetical protein
LNALSLRKTSTFKFLTCGFCNYSPMAHLDWNSLTSTLPLKQPMFNPQGHHFHQLLAITSSKPQMRHLVALFVLGFLTLGTSCGFGLSSSCTHKWKTEVKNLECNLPITCRFGQHSLCPYKRPTRVRTCKSCNAQSYSWVGLEPCSGNPHQISDCNFGGTHPS